MENKIYRGDIYYYNYGENPGSIQCGRRPVLVVQSDDFNVNAPTIIVAAITSVIKKQYLPSHIVLPDTTGLKCESMVMLEQIRAVNKTDLEDYVGTLIDEESWKRINNGLKKEFGLWFYKTERSSEIRCLCPRCLADYKATPGIVVKRLDPFAKTKERCIKCYGQGYDYIVYDQRSSK